LSVAPSSAPSSLPSDHPTTSTCLIPEDVREEEILAILDSVADPSEIRDLNLPQGLATEWLLNEDDFFVCPDTPKLVQRWVLAVTYFSTGGDSWIQCSANASAVDICGTEDPFLGKTEFLSPDQECSWAGISCIDGCVTEIEFEDNNLVGESVC